MYFANYRLPKMWLDKCIGIPVPEDPSTSNLVNDPKHCCYLHDSTFIRFINQCADN